MCWNSWKITYFTEFHRSARFSWKTASFTENVMAVILWIKLVPAYWTGYTYLQAPVASQLGRFGPNGALVTMGRSGPGSQKKELAGPKSHRAKISLGRVWKFQSMQTSSARQRSFSVLIQLVLRWVTIRRYTVLMFDQLLTPTQPPTGCRKCALWCKIWSDCWFLDWLHFAWVVDDVKCIVVTRVCVSVCLCVCLSVRDRMPTLLHRPRCNLG